MSCTERVSGDSVKPIERVLSFCLSRSLRILEENQRLYYTTKQLYYEFCRGLMPGIPRFPSAIPFPLRPWIDYARFSRLMSERLKTVESPARLVQSCERPLNPLDRELGDYGMPRLMICQSRDTAHMLIANNAHMELVCGIIDLECATPLPDLLCAMLGRASEPRIFFLHDASRAGYESALNLRALIDPPSRVAVTGLGLRPAAVFNLHLFCIRRTDDLSSAWENPSYLSDRESDWLRKGWCAEIESLHPVQLLTFLKNAVTQEKPGYFSAVDLDGKSLRSA